MRICFIRPGLLIPLCGLMRFPLPGAIGPVRSDRRLWVNVCLPSSARANPHTREVVLVNLFRPNERPIKRPTEKYGA